MEKHKKYRDEIRNMPDSAFTKYQTSSLSMSTSDLTLLQQADDPNKSISYGALLESAKHREDPFFKNETPYELYLRKKRNVLIAKFVLLGLAVIGMAVWFILMQGRR